MKNFIVLLFFVPLFAGAQKTHTVQPKETLYSLARKYNIHPRELAAYNNISVETSLSVGQVVKIPAKGTMPPLTSAVPEKKEPVVKPAAEIKTATVTKPITQAKKEGSSPIYHKVARKETLYHISKLYENVTIDDIKKWNKLATDGVSEGTNLIVGYGKEVAKKPVQPTVETKTETVKTVVKETPKTVEPEKKEAEKVVKAEPQKKEINNVTGKDFNGGVFRSLYEKQVATKSSPAELKGAAGVFKSTSGWEDGKYYCLSNSVPPGTIVKITNPANQNAVYAKVLDLIPDLKQNAGVIIRISNAAASALGANTDHFESTINF